jgi:hypothetical protein
VNPAADDAARLAAAVVPLVERAHGAGWYEIGNDADAALVALCRLRRAGAGKGGSIESGDEAVRQALSQADPEAVIWLASRAISYADENGYPDSVSI